MCVYNLYIYRIEAHGNQGIKESRNTRIDEIPTNQDERNIYVSS